MLNLPAADGAMYRVGEMLARLGSTGVIDRLWQRGFPSPHLFYFTPRTLQAMAERAGFSTIALRRLPSIELPGLWPRLRMDPRMSGVVAGTAYLGLVALYPLLRWILPSDIMLQISRRK